MDDLRLSFLAVLLRHSTQLFADDIFDLRIGFQRFVQVFDIFLKDLQFFDAFDDVFLVDITQFDLRDVFRLHFINVKPCHQVGYDHLFLFRISDDGNGLIDIRKDLRQTLQQVEFFRFFLNIEGDLSADGIHTEIRPLLQDIAYPQNHRSAMDKDIEIAAEIIRQWCHGIQFMHQQFHIRTAFQVDGDFQTVQVRFISHIGDILDLARLYQCNDFINDSFNISRIRDLCHFDTVILFIILILCTEFYAAAACLIDLFQFFSVINQLTACRKIRGRKMFHQINSVILDKFRCCFAQFRQIEAADGRSHTNGDTQIGVRKDIGESCRQEGRFSHAAIIVIHKINGIFVDIRKDFLTDRFQFYFCITGCSISHILGIIFTKVPLGVYKRHQQGFIIPCQTHHGFIDSTVTVRVQFHGLTNYIGRLCSVALQKAHLIHGIQQLSVGRLEAINFRDRTGNDDTHGIGHVVQLQCIGDALLLNEVIFIFFFGWSFFLSHNPPLN